MNFLSTEIWQWRCQKDRENKDKKKKVKGRKQTKTEGKIEKIYNKFFANIKEWNIVQQQKKKEKENKGSALLIGSTLLAFGSREPKAQIMVGEKFFPLLFLSHHLMIAIELIHENE